MKNRSTDGRERGSGVTHQDSVVLADSCAPWSQREGIQGSWWVWTSIESAQSRWNVPRRCKMLDTKPQISHTGKLTAWPDTWSRGTSLEEKLAPASGRLRGAKRNYLEITLLIIITKPQRASAASLQGARAELGFLKCRISPMRPWNHLPRTCRLCSINPGFLKCPPKDFGSTWLPVFPVSHKFLI